MPLVEVALSVKVDGQQVAGGPFTFRFNPAEVVMNEIVKSGSDGVTYVGQTKLATDNGILLFTDTALNVGFLNQSTGLALGAGGLVLVLGGTLSTSPNLSVNNTSGSNANLKILEFGP